MENYMRLPTVPYEVFGRAHEVSSANQLTYANTHERGFMLVEVNENSHLVKYIFVSVDTDGGSGEQYDARCDAAFEVRNRGASADGTRQRMTRLEDCVYHTSGVATSSRSFAVPAAGAPEAAYVSETGSGISTAVVIVIALVVAAVASSATYVLLRIKGRAAGAKYVEMNAVEMM